MQVVAVVGDRIEFPLRPGNKCWSVWKFPQQGYEFQVWAKPQPHGAVAVLAINGNATIAQTTTVPLAALSVSSTSVTVRDVWHHTDNGTIKGAVTITVPAMDSAFV